MVGNHTCSRSPRPRLLFATFSWKLGFLRHWKPRAWGMGGGRMVVSWDAKLGCLGAWRKDGSLSTENALSLCLEPGIFGAELGSGANRLRHLTMPIHSSPRVAKSEGHDIAWEFGSCFGVITVSIPWANTHTTTNRRNWVRDRQFLSTSFKQGNLMRCPAVSGGLHQYPQVGFLLDQPGSRRSQSRSMGGRIHCRWFTKQFACHDHRTTWLPKKERTDLFRGYDFE